MIAAIVLSAGLSSRMAGFPKGLLRVDERDSFVTRIVRTFADAGISDVVVVLGHRASEIAGALERSGLPARSVVNEQYERGQLSSLLAGLDAVDRPGVDGFLLALVDAPLFSASTVRAVVERRRAIHAPIVRAVRGAEHGHPVLIGRELFDQLRHADPERGAKPVVRANASSAGDVEVEDPGAFVDVDTPADYERVFGRPVQS